MSGAVQVGTAVVRAASRLRGERVIHGRGRAMLVGTVHGPWQQVGVLTTTGEVPAPQGQHLRFNPGVTGGGLRLAGPFQSWRRSAYPVAQDVR